MLHLKFVVILLMSLLTTIEPILLHSVFSHSLENIESSSHNLNVFSLALLFTIFVVSTAGNISCQCAMQYQVCVCDCIISMLA